MPKKSKKVEVVEDDNPKKLGFFDIAKNIVSETASIEWDEIKSEYNAFMINKILSQYKDTLFMAQEMNQYYSLDEEMQYQFLFNSIDKRKRYVPWEKADTQLDEKIKIVKESLGYSTIRCREIIPIIDSLDLWDQIQESLYKGGSIKQYKRSKKEIIK